MEKAHKMLINRQHSKVFDRDMADLCPSGMDIKTFAALGEAGRLDAIRAAAQPPEICGPDIPMAPARGAVSSFRPIELVPGSLGTARDAGHWERGEGTRRRAARIDDVFAKIESDARAAHKAKGEGAGRFVPPFTPGQVQIGRDYRDIVARREAGGMKCASLEAAGRGGAGGGEFIDAFTADGDRLREMRDRIGTGTAMQIRRIRPSRRGAHARGIITDRALVDDVCLGEMKLGQVLKAHGWAERGGAREALRRALAAALDRMIGYDGRRRQKNT